MRKRGKERKIAQVGFKIYEMQISPPGLFIRGTKVLSDYYFFFERTLSRDYRVEIGIIVETGTVNWIPLPPPPSPKRLTPS